MYIIYIYTTRIILASGKTSENDIKMLMHSFWTPAPLRNIYIYTHIYLRPHAEIRGNKIIKNKKRIPRYNPRRVLYFFFLLPPEFYPSREWRLYTLYIQRVYSVRYYTNTIIIYEYIYRRHVLAPARPSCSRNKCEYVAGMSKTIRTTAGWVWGIPAVAGGWCTVLQLHSTAAATGLKVYQLFFYSTYIAICAPICM